MLAQYFHPEMIYLKTGGMTEPLNTQGWVPIKVNNVTLAYGTTVNNVSMGIVEVIHTNKAALMSVIVYGFTGAGGGYGTTANAFISEIGNFALCLSNMLSFSQYTYVGIPHSKLNQMVDLLVNNQNLTLNCNARDFDNSSISGYIWRKDDEVIYPDNHYIATTPSLIIVNLTIRDTGHYQCIMLNSIRRKIAINTIHVIIKGTCIKIV